MAKSLLETLYYKLPYRLQVFLFNQKARQKFQNRTSSGYQEYLESYQNNWNADIQTVEEFQKKELTEFLLFSLKYSEWYAEKFNEKGITGGQIQNDPYSSLRRLPLLAKKDIVNHLDLIINKQSDLGKVIPVYTSGSTGTPMKTLACPDSENRLHAIKKRFHHSVGVPVDNLCIRFSGNKIISLDRDKSPYWHHNQHENVWFFSIYHFRTETMPVFIDKLNEVKPHLLDGYPSAINVLANYINNQNIKLSFVPKAICTTAEPLTPHIRHNIEKAFKCGVYNQYSTSEGATFITECKNKKLHVNIDTGVAEYLNQKGEPGKPGEHCELVVTSFINKKTPLIRYRTGDWVKLSWKDEKCDCGCQMPVIEDIFGRYEDYLVDENGVEQGMVSYRVFKTAQHILKAQIIQTAKNRCIVRIVKDADYGEKTEAQIKAKLTSILGSSFDIRFEYCDDIETGANGKFKTVINQTKNLHTS